MPDQRRVGHAIRRRMGAPMSHTGMAEQGANMAGAWKRPPAGQAALGAAEATAQGAGQTAPTGGSPKGGRLKGVPDVYETGTASYGMGSGPPLGDNSAFVAGVKGGVDAEPHPSRSRMSPGESAGARLTVSPSMKFPEQSPVPTQGGGRIVPSTPSRQGSFSQGQAGAYGG